MDTLPAGEMFTVQKMMDEGHPKRFMMAGNDDRYINTFMCLYFFN